MNFDFTDEQNALRSMVSEFAADRIAPHALQWDEDHHFPSKTVREMGELGLFGITADEQWGGAGGDLTSLCIAIEELARADQSMAITLEAGVGLLLSHAEPVELVEAVAFAHADIHPSFRKEV